MTDKPTRFPGDKEADILGFVVNEDGNGPYFGFMTSDGIEPMARFGTRDTALAFAHGFNFCVCIAQLTPGREEVHADELRALVSVAAKGAGGITIVEPKRT